MAKDPAFLFYHHDFLIGTSFLSFEERGAYITLLSHMAAQAGRLSVKQVMVICGNFDPQELLLSKFKIDECGNYYNQRLLEEIQKRKKFTQSRLDNLHMGHHKESHMVNVNRNRNKYKKVVKTQPINKEPEVRLSELERKKLVEVIGKHGAADYIERLDLYIGSKGDKYKSHSKTILSWWKKDGKPVNKKDQYERQELEEKKKIEEWQKGNNVTPQNAIKNIQDVNHLTQQILKQNR